MDKDSTKKAAQRVRRSVSPSAAEESLTDALNGLEQILEHRQRPPSEPREGPATEPDAAPADPQYTIPLLHDVVVPGSEGPAARNTDGHAPGDAVQDSLDDDEACRKLAERLASEIEVIVEARVEAAVQAAARDIREQVRNHLEIMLPEIIEELNAFGRR